MPDNELPFVSVIVPVRNEERFVGGCLESLLGQDYPKDQLEIIGVDNDSTDRSAAIIRQFPVRYLFEKKRGAAAARNAGARVARGDFLAFIDSDCAAPQNWVRELVRALTKNAADACGGDYAMASPPPAGTASPNSFVKDYLDFRGIYSQSKFFSDSSPTPPWLLTGNLMVRRTVFEKVGGIEETLFLAEDIDLSWKIVGRGGSLEYSPSIKVIHRDSPSLFRFYFKNFRVGMAAFLLNHRYQSVFFQKKEGPFEFLQGFFDLFRKLKGHLDRLFLIENNLSFYRKWGYLFLVVTGHFSFQAGKWLNRIRYNVMKRPIPVPVFQKESELPSQDLQPETV